MTYDELLNATERHWQRPELLADALADAWAQGHAAGWADGAIAGAESERERGDGLCDACVHLDAEGHCEYVGNDPSPLECCRWFPR